MQAQLPLVCVADVTKNMSPIKKIDYRQISKEAPQEVPQQAPQEGVPTVTPAEQAEQAPQQAEVGQLSFFGSLKNKLTLMSKKEKIEALVLIVVLCAIVVVILYYFSNKSPKFNPETSYAPPAEEGL